MVDSVLRKQIVLKNRKQKELFEKFVHTSNFPSFSHMCRYAITELIKKENNHSFQEYNELSDKINIFHDSLYKKITDLLTHQQLLEIKIEKEGLTDEIGSAVGDIARLLLNRDKPHNEILAEVQKYDDKTKYRAINILKEATLMGYSKKIIKGTMEKNDRKGKK